MESIIYRGIEIRTEESRTGGVWLQTRTQESAQAYAEATGEVVMSYLHTIGWVEATVEEIREQIDEMLGEAPTGEVVPAPADDGSVGELAEIDEATASAGLMAWQRMRERAHQSHAEKIAEESLAEQEFRQERERILAKYGVA